MPTIRSKYSLEQFRQVLQQRAHKIALDAVKSRREGSIRIRMSGGRFTVVEILGEVKIKFYAKHILFEREDGEQDVALDVERKLYLTSGDSTKISYWAPEDQLAAAEQAVRSFIHDLMADVEPVARFTLSMVQ